MCGEEQYKNWRGSNRENERIERLRADRDEKGEGTRREVGGEEERGWGDEGRPGRYTRPMGANDGFSSAEIGVRAAPQTKISIGASYSISLVKLRGHKEPAVVRACSCGHAAAGSAREKAGMCITAAKRIISVYRHKSCTGAASMQSQAGDTSELRSAAAGLGQ